MLFHKDQVFALGLFEFVEFYNGFVEVFTADFVAFIILKIVDCLSPQFLNIEFRDFCSPEFDTVPPLSSHFPRPFYPLNPLFTVPEIREFPNFPHFWGQEVMFRSCTNCCLISNDLRHHQSADKSAHKSADGFSRKVDFVSYWFVRSYDFENGLPGTGFEPARSNLHQPLKLARLPIPPPGRAKQKLYPYFLKLQLKIRALPVNALVYC